MFGFHTEILAASECERLVGEHREGCHLELVIFTT